ncbi:MAG TPA: hypothetical protein VG345_01620 [Bryobacteraceae bacterium]|nr:hypothetical protein [Bryobacteraceae bacterium]
MVRRIWWILPLAAVLHASILPTLHLDPATLKAFEEYVAEFEKGDAAAFTASGKLWIDNGTGLKRNAWLSGKPVVEARENENVAAGSIHHFSGSIRVEGARLDQWRKVMQDYPDYPKLFAPDVAGASATVESDNSASDQHFHSRLLLNQSTLWIAVAYDSLYDTHYRKIDANRWTSKSASISIKELRDPKNPQAGAYPEGDDHGFLWKTNTYWFARERNNGLDLQADSVNLSRPIPTGAAWWGSRRTREAVEKMLTDTRNAIQSLH